MTDIRIEHIVNFSIHFPEGYLLKIESNANLLAFYVINSILTKFGIAFDDIELV